MEGSLTDMGPIYWRRFGLYRHGRRRNRRWQCCRQLFVRRPAQSFGGCIADCHALQLESHLRKLSAFSRSWLHCS